jgi:hypothetical protein
MPTASAQAASISVSDAEVGEGDAAAGSFSITRSSLTSCTSATVTMSGTVAASDYVASAATGTISGTHPTYTIGWPASSTTMQLQITPTSDTIDEAGETLSAALSGGAPAVTCTGLSGSATLTFKDDDPTITLSVSDSDLAERYPDDYGAVRLSRTTADYPIAVAVSYTGTAGATDYQSSGTSIAIAAGALIQDVGLYAVPDRVDEGAETITVTAGACPCTGYQLGASSSSTVSLVDDDSTVSLSGPITVTEGGAATITLTRTNPRYALTVDLAGVDGSARSTGGSLADYASVQDATFAAGSTSTTVDLTITDNEVAEFTEAFSVVLRSPHDATLSTSAVRGVSDRNSAVLADGAVYRAPSGFPPLHGTPRCRLRLRNRRHQALPQDLFLGHGDGPRRLGIPHHGRHILATRHRSLEWVGLPARRHRRHNGGPAAHRRLPD